MSKYPAHSPYWSAGYDHWESALIAVEEMSAEMHSKTNEADHRVVMRVLQRVRDRAEA